MWLTVLLYRKLLIFGFKWGTKGTFSPCSKSRNTTHFPCASDVRQSCVCVPCFLWKSALLLSLNLLSFPFSGSVLLLWTALPPAKKSFSRSSFFEMAVFFYSAFVCRLLIITIFLPSLQYLFSVFCRRKSGHLPELPWEEFFIIVTAAYCCRINAHGGRIQ